MNSINNVADYIILSLLADGNRYHLSPAKLHKLLYYVEAWSLGINDRPFFEGNTPFEAWVHGPVNITIHERFATKSIYEDISREDVIAHNIRFLEEDEQFINYILENYARYNGYELEIMCINEQPWIEARSGCSRFDECHREIDEGLMRKYYRERYEKLS